jgi:hypothetical protein
MMSGLSELDEEKELRFGVLERAKCRFAFRLLLQTALRVLNCYTLRVNQQLIRPNRAKEQTQKKELNVEPKHCKNLIIYKIPDLVFVTPDLLCSSTNADIQQN